MYNLHWRYGIDFKFMGIQPSPYWTSDDKSVVLRFNYTAVREKYLVKRIVHGTVDEEKVYDELSARPDPNTCLNGQTFNDKDNKLFYLCISGKDKSKYEYITVLAIPCV